MVENHRKGKGGQKRLRKGQRKRDLKDYKDYRGQGIKGRRDTKWM